MARLDQERQKELEPKRMDYAIDRLKEFVVIDWVSETEIQFWWDGHIVKFFPYSGWHTGKSIKDGRGIDKLLKQLK